jgi:hypothetical protein
MECPSCQFNNMPGNARCLRCGSALQLATAAISVEPPRASARRKWLRKQFNGRRWWYWARDASSGAGRSLASELTRETVTGGLDLGLWARSLFPGWAHWHAGYRLRGAIIALIYWPALLAMLATVGGPSGTFWLGAMLAIHAASLIDLLIAADQTRFERYCLVPLAAVAIVACFYGPVVYAVGSQVFVRRLQAPIGRFSTGDVLWFRHLPAGNPKVQPGDVVLYDVGSATMQLPNHRAFQVNGDRIDRVIAGPGSHVQWRDGHFEVNGQPTAWMPLGMAAAPAGFTLMVHDREVGHMEAQQWNDTLTGWGITVPPDNYCIVPSTIPLPNVPDGSVALRLFWTKLALVPAERIQGRAWMCGYPPAHWSRID